MSIELVNCSYLIFEDLLIIGAIFIPKSNIDATILHSSFTRCTRSEQSGGAVYCYTENGRCNILKNCFDMCFTNTFNVVDYGQSAYVSSSFTIFSDNSVSFCSVDDSVVRNAGFCAKLGEVKSERVNISHGLCSYAAGMLFSNTNTATVSDSTMFNLTSSTMQDTISLYVSNGPSTFTRIIYIQCINPSDGTPNYGSSQPLSISQCVFVDCTNFGNSFYTSGSNTHTSTTEIGLKKPIICNLRQISCGCSNEKHLAFIAGLLLCLN